MVSLFRAVVGAALLVLVLVLALGALGTIAAEWQGRAGAEVGTLLPTPTQIGAAWEAHRDTLLTLYIPNTLRVTLLGLGLAVVLSLALAAAMDLLPPLRVVAYPLLVLSQTVPTFAIAVILILLFGFGDSPKIVVVVLFCFYAMTTHTLDGLGSIDPLQEDVARSMGANRLQVWRLARLPHALPSFFSGLRVAATYSVVGAVIGEFVGSGDGLGKFLQRSYRSFNSDQVFLAVTIIAALSVALVLLVALAERVMIHWYHAKQTAGRNFIARGNLMLKRILKPALFIIPLLLTSTAAAQDDSARLDEPTSVRLMLDWTPNTNHTGFYAAQALGYYDALNLAVEILEPAEVSVESALDAGIVEFGVGFQEFTTFALAEGAAVVSVAAIIQHNTSGFATLADDHPVAAPADLAGLDYAGYGFPDLENAVLSTLLACDDSAWDTAYYLEIGNVDPLQLMAQGRAAFAWIFYGWQGIAAELDGLDLDVVMLNEYADCVPDYYTPILLTSQSMIDAQPEVVRAFVQATAQGYQYAIENPEEAAALLLDAVPELDADLVTASAVWLADQYQADAPRWGEQRLDIWQGFTAFLVENGMIADMIDVEAAFTNAFLPQG